MPIFVDFYALSSTHLAKLSASEGVVGLLKRCQEHGEHLGKLNYGDFEPAELFEPVDDLLGTRLGDLLGCAVGPVDGTNTKPLVGHLSDDELTDAVDALEQLNEAIQLDADDLDDEDDGDDEDEDEEFERPDVYKVRAKVGEIAESLGVTLEDDLAEYIDDLLDTLRCGVRSKGDLLGVVHVPTDH